MSLKIHDLEGVFDIEIKYLEEEENPRLLLVLSNFTSQYMLLQLATQERNESLLAGEIIKKQKLEIEAKNKDIFDSIVYAKQLQNTILSTELVFQKHFTDSFILNLPRDIVSGDFYWFHLRGDDLLYAAVDCTGHGVPGAMMSVLANNELNKVANDLTLSTPAALLEQLSLNLSEIMQDRNLGIKLNDGMDIALCQYNRHSGLLQYAGAHSPLYRVSQNELDVFSADRKGIGGFGSGRDRVFTNHTISLKTGDCIYLFTDGFSDQFGGEKGKKFKSRQFKALLSEIHDLPMAQQEDRLCLVHQDWRGKLDQVDDILVLGIRF